MKIETNYILTDVRYDVNLKKLLYELKWNGKILMNFMVIIKNTQTQ